MKAQQIRKFDMLRRVQQFLDEFAVKLSVVNATAARKELDQLVEEMGVDETVQATSTLNAKSHTATQAVLRRDLVNHYMRPVATIAAARLRDVPGFKALQLPRIGVKVAVLVQDATAMTEAARAYKQVLWRTAVRRISPTRCWQREGGADRGDDSGSDGTSGCSDD